MIEETIQARLVAQISSVPASRIRTPGDWQEMARPNIVHGLVTEGGDEHVHGGIVTAKIHDFYQVSVYADSRSSAITVAEEVRAALNGYTAAELQLVKHLGTAPAFDPEIKIFHWAMNFMIAETLST